MRVLLITTAYPPPPGGIQTVTRNLERTLNMYGHNVRVLHINPDDHRALVNAHPQDYLPRTKTYYSWQGVVSADHVYLNAVYRRVQETIDNFDPDIIHAMHIKNWPALIAAKEEAIPSIVSTHSLELQNESLAAIAFRDATIVHSNSNFTSDLVDNIAVRYGVEPISTRVIHPSIDVQKYERKDEFDLKTKRKHGPVVTMARFVNRKNIESVIEAWKSLPQPVRKDRDLLIVGDGEKRKILERIASTESDIEFLGWISEEEKVNLLNQASLFVLTPVREEYDVEGFGIVYIEAQAAKTPVIASSYGGVPEAVGDGGDIVESARNPSEIAKSIGEVLSNNARYRSYVENIQERIQLFDNMKVAEEYISVYNGLIKHNG